MSSISVTSPANIRIENRQAKNRAREATPERREEVRLWCIGKKCSCGCGQDANTPHHPTDMHYADEIWANLDECEPWRSGCHHLYHKGLERCPVCHGWMKRGREKCSKCEGWRSRNIRRGKLKHPCGKNEGRQECSDGRVCGYSPKKADCCDYFEARVPA